MMKGLVFGVLGIKFDFVFIIQFIRMIDVNIVKMIGD